MQNKCKTLLATAALMAVSLYAQFAIAQAGQLDSSFGQGGKIITSFGNLNPAGQVNAVPFALLEQPDGNLVVLGQLIGGTPNLANQAVALVRYLPNGGLDRTFGNGGIAVAAFDNFISFGYSLALMPDGRIVVSGEEQSSDGSVDRFGVARFNPNGTLDRTFGGTGTVTTEFFAAPQPGGREAAFAVVVQSDGKIVAGGEANFGEGTPILTALARYNTDGSLDTSFGKGGKATTSAVPGPVQSLALLSDGHILALSGTRSVEFSANGVLQSNVVGGSIVATSTGGQETFQADDRFLQIRAFFVNRRTAIVDVVRSLAAGSADSTFNDPPFNFAGNNTTRASGNAIVIQADGRSVVGGTTAGLFGLARLNQDGSLDQTFGKGGMLTTAFASTAGVTAATIQSDGKILAAGIVLDPTTGAAGFALARYLGR